MRPRRRQFQSATIEHSVKWLQGEKTLMLRCESLGKAAHEFLVSVCDAAVFQSRTVSRHEARPPVLSVANSLKEHELCALQFGHPPALLFRLKIGAAERAHGMISGGAKPGRERP